MFSQLASPSEGVAQHSSIHVLRSFEKKNNHQLASNPSGERFKVTKLLNGMGTSKQALHNTNPEGNLALNLLSSPEFRSFQDH
ncbi:hypothetical protein D5086_024415 [Populus alba]|uniref:Uncharacterized protein n=1 Tax=Populus alba TaxID=43335 RepID=A0ACC4B6Z7_POPAL